MIFTPSVNIYVGTNRISVAKITQNIGGSHQLADFAEVSIKKIENTDSFAQFDALNLGEALKAAVQKIPVKGKKVFVALSGADTLIRFFQMPVLPKSERRQSAYFEAQKYLPSDIRDLYHNAEISAVRKEKQMSVVFYAARKAIVDHLLSFLYREGALSVSVEPAAFPLIRTYRFSGGGAKLSDTLALVDLQEEGAADILLAREGMILLQRDFVLPVANEGQPDYPSLRTEIQLSLDYFAKNYKNETVEKFVFFISPKVEFPELLKNIKADFDLPIETPVPGTRLKGFPNLGPALAVLLGLALRKTRLKRTAKTANLAAGEALKNEQTPASTAAFKRCLSYEALGLGAVFLVIHGLLFSSLGTQKKELQAQTAALPKPAILAGLELSDESIQTAQTELLQKQKTLAVLFGQKVYVTQKMGEVARMIHDNIYLTALAYSDAEAPNDQRVFSLMLEGQMFAAESEDGLQNLNRWVAELRKSPGLMNGLDDIKISSAQKTRVKTEATMTFSLEGTNRHA